MSLDDNCTVSSVALTYVVGLPLESHATVASGVKFLPVTVNVTFPDPKLTEFGLKPVMTGRPAVSKTKACPCEKAGPCEGSSVVPTTCPVALIAYACAVKYHVSQVPEMD